MSNLTQKNAQNMIIYQINCKYLFRKVWNVEAVYRVMVVASFWETYFKIFVSIKYQLCVIQNFWQLTQCHLITKTVESDRHFYQILYFQIFILQKNINNIWTMLECFQNSLSVSNIFLHTTAKVNFTGVCCWSIRHAYLLSHKISPPYKGTPPFPSFLIFLFLKNIM